MAALLENSSLFLAQPAIQERTPGTIARGLGSFTRLSRRTHACRMHRFAVVHGPGPRPGSLAGRVRSNSETSTSSSVRALLDVFTMMRESGVSLHCSLPNMMDVPVPLAGIFGDGLCARRVGHSGHIQRLHLGLPPGRAGSRRLGRQQQVAS